MNDTAVSALRAWIRNADDSRYGNHISQAVAQSPRTAVTDLYKPLREARERCPVQPFGQSQLAGLEDFVTMPLFSERRLFSLLGFGEVKKGFTETAVFSSAIHNETIGQV